MALQKRAAEIYAHVHWGASEAIKINQLVLFGYVSHMGGGVSGGIRNFPTLPYLNSTGLFFATLDSALIHLTPIDSF